MEDKTDSKDKMEDYEGDTIEMENESYRGHSPQDQIIYPIFVKRINTRLKNIIEFKTLSQDQKVPYHSYAFHIGRARPSLVSRYPPLKKKKRIRRMFKLMRELRRDISYNNAHIISVKIMWDYVLLKKQMRGIKMREYYKKYREFVSGKIKSDQKVNVTGFYSIDSEGIMFSCLDGGRNVEVFGKDILNKYWIGIDERGEEDLADFNIEQMSNVAPPTKFFSELERIITWRNATTLNALKLSFLINVGDREERRSETIFLETSLAYGIKVII